MTNATTVKIGKMPGRLNEFVLEANTTVAQALEIAELTVGEFEVKVDGNTVTDFSQTIAGANTILLTAKVKGNAVTTVKVGKMPGRLNEFALDSSTTYAEALAIAELTVGEFEVKVDGNTVTDFNQPIGNANTILLTAKVKGNALTTVKIGKMPGRLDEYALDSTTTFEQALATAELTVGEFEVKADGNTVTDFSQEIGSANTILLTAKVKGNK